MKKNNLEKISGIEGKLETVRQELDKERSFSGRSDLGYNRDVLLWEKRYYEELERSGIESSFIEELPYDGVEKLLRDYCLGIFLDINCEKNTGAVLYAPNIYNGIISTRIKTFNIERTREEKERYEDDSKFWHEGNGRTIRDYTFERFNILNETNKNVYFLEKIKILEKGENGAVDIRLEGMREPSFLEIIDSKIDNTKYEGEFRLENNKIKELKRFEIIK